MGVAGKHWWARPPALRLWLGAAPCLVPTVNWLSVFCLLLPPHPNCCFLGFSPKSTAFILLPVSESLACGRSQKKTVAELESEPASSRP